VTSYDIRLILKPSMTETNLFTVAQLNNWVLYDIGNRNAEVYINKWHAFDEKVWIHYVEDPLTGTAFVTFRGEGSAAAAQMVRDDCDLWEYPEALEVLQQASGRDERLTAAYAAALTAPTEQDEALVEEFRAFAHDSDPGIRQSVVVATAYLPYPALQELVTELSENDPEQHVRHNAQVLLEGLHLHGEES
jgi:hypothetical protein